MNNSVRPNCTNCDKPAAQTHKDKFGNIVYRKYKDMPGEGWCCSKCHNDRITKRHGVSSVIELTAARKGVSVSQLRKENLIRTASQAGMTVSEYRKNQLENRAAELGLTVYEYRVLQSKYLWYREKFNYCENIDGRLGFICTTNVVTIPGVWNGMLDVDHIDGNHTHNNEDNLQTLCKCCHSYKSWKEEDFKTPGRKTRNKKVAS